METGLATQRNATETCQDWRIELLIYTLEVFLFEVMGFLFLILSCSWMVISYMWFFCLGILLFLKDLPSILKQIYLFWGGSRVISRRFNLALYNEDVSFLEFTKTIIFRGQKRSLCENKPLKQVLGWSSQNILKSYTRTSNSWHLCKPENSPRNEDLRRWKVHGGKQETLEVEGIECWPC